MVCVISMGSGTLLAFGTARQENGGADPDPNPHPNSDPGSNLTLTLTLTLILLFQNKNKEHNSSTFSTKFFNLIHHFE